MEGMRQETEKLKVTIRIQDQNDNHPQFSKSKFFVELLEESPRDHSAIFFDSKEKFLNLQNPVLIIKNAFFV